MSLTAIQNKLQQNETLTLEKKNLLVANTFLFVSPFQFLNSLITTRQISNDILV